MAFIQNSGLNPAFATTERMPNSTNRGHTDADGRRQELLQGYQHLNNSQNPGPALKFETERGTALESNTTKAVALVILAAMITTVIIGVLGLTSVIPMSTGIAATLVALPLIPAAVALDYVIKH